MKQDVKVITELALETNITEARHIIGLIGYYRKFFAILCDIIRPLSKLTMNNVPFKWTNDCQKRLDYIKEITTTRPILAYPDIQYYHFRDSSKDSWSRVLVHYNEQKQ